MKLIGGQNLGLIGGDRSEVRGLKALAALGPRLGIGGLDVDGGASGDGLGRHQCGVAVAVEAITVWFEPIAKDKVTMQRAAWYGKAARSDGLRRLCFPSATRGSVTGWHQSVTDACVN